jgi:hypothetical protein
MLSRMLLVMSSSFDKSTEMQTFEVHVTVFSIDVAHIAAYTRPCREAYQYVCI